MSDNTTNLSPKLAELVKSIEGLTALELSDLVKALETKFGITAAAPMMMAGPAAGGGHSVANCLRPPSPPG